MDYVQSFADYLKGNAKSNKTQQNYIVQLQYCLDYLGADTNDKILAINQKDIIGYLSDIITKKKLDISTRNTYLIAIKSFFLYLSQIEKKQIDKDILNIPNIKPPKKQEIYLDEVEADRMLDEPTNIRTQVIIKLFLKTGIRVSEIATIQLEDLEELVDDEGYCYFKIRIHGKGNKIRYVYTDNSTALSIKKYIGKRRKKTLEQYNNTQCQYLLISNWGNPMNVRHIRSAVKNCAIKLGVRNADKMSPHKLRHTYATLMLNAIQQYEDMDGNIVDGGKKYDIKTVSVSMGHENIQTTNRYTHSDERRVSEMQRGGW